MKVFGLGALELLIIALVIAAAVVAVVVYKKKGGGASQVAKPVFCPKCGAELPGTATFCPKCGNALPANITQQAASVQASVANPFNPVGIASRVCAVVAIVAMFMPWLEVPGMQSLKGLASSVGISMSSDFAYPMFNMGEVTKTLDFLSNSNAFSGIQMMFLAAWVIALALLVVGLVRSFVGKKSTGSLLIGGIVAALVAILWFAVVTYLDGEYARQVAQLIGSRVQFFVVPAAVWVTVVTGLAAGILGILGKGKA